MVSPTIKTEVFKWKVMVYKPMGKDLPLYLVANLNKTPIKLENALHHRDRIVNCIPYVTEEWHLFWIPEISTVVYTHTTDVTLRRLNMLEKFVYGITNRT